MNFVDHKVELGTLKDAMEQYMKDLKFPSNDPRAENLSEFLKRARIVLQDLGPALETGVQAVNGAQAGAIFGALHAVAVPALGTVAGPIGAAVGGGLMLGVPNALAALGEKVHIPRKVTTIASQLAMLGGAAALVATGVVSSSAVVPGAIVGGALAAIFSAIRRFGGA